MMSIILLAEQKVAKAYEESGVGRGEVLQCRFEQCIA